MMPPKRKEVSSTASAQTEQTGRRSRASSRAASSTLTAASSTSVSRSPDASISQLRLSRGEAQARAASRSTASSKTSRAESTFQSPTSTESIITGSSRPSSSVSANSRSKRTASSSQSPSSSVSSTVKNTQPSPTSTTEPRNGHIRQLGPSVRVLHLNVPSVRPSLAGSSASTSSSNRSTNEAGNSTTPSAEVLGSSQDVIDQLVSAQEGSCTLPRAAELPPVFSEDGSSSPPSGAESGNGVSSPELDESSISVSDEDRSFQSVVFDWDTTVDLTSPARPGIARAVPNFRRLSEALLQQDDLDDFSEMTLTSPPATPPHRNLTTLPGNNLVDMTIDLTDSPVAAPAPSASPEQNSLGPASGSISQIRCPVCLDDLPQITSTRRNLMSTVCGHVFCSSCLPLCVRSNGRCPSCRKVLHPNQMHPIFI